MPQWRAYVDYFSNIVIEGFSKAITCTVRHLLSQVRVCFSSVITEMFRSKVVYVWSV